MPAYKSYPTGDVAPAPYEPPLWHGRTDSSMRLLVSVIQHRDNRLLKLRTGVERKRKHGKKSGKSPGKIPVTIELQPKKGKPSIDEKLAATLGVAEMYVAEAKRNKALRHVTKNLTLDGEIFDGKPNKLIGDIKSLLINAQRVDLGVPGYPCRGPALGDIGLPIHRKYKGKVLTGRGVVVGIIDDGCAFAEWNFVDWKNDGSLESRVRFLLNQEVEGPGIPGPYGSGSNPNARRELSGKEIADEIENFRDGDVIDEDGVYEALSYRPGQVRTHGTHVMDIAAGRGQSLMGVEGVAYGADIVFVQLPRAKIEKGAPAFVQYVIEAANYIFNRADALGKPAVINISYGGYDGPHDGTSPLEQALDELLSVPGRAIVLAAGNGFEAHCHSCGTVVRNGNWYLRWIVPPEDPTDNTVEIWYAGTSSLEVRLRSPGGAIEPADWIALNFAKSPIRRAHDQKIIGYIEHVPGTTANGDNMIVVTLRPTEADEDADGNDHAPALPGTWKIELRHTAGGDAAFHAWVHRDDGGRAANSRRRQSRFDERDSKPCHTITGWASGKRTISAGAFNVATQEVCGYSACGPTRPTGLALGRAKPDVYAPAEESARGRGVLSASALSARPTRLNGTSAAAPFVTGLIALMYEYAIHAGKLKNRVNLPSASAIRDALFKSATRNKLKPNRHQLVDVHMPIKQDDVWDALVASGKIDFLKAMKKLFP